MIQTIQTKSQIICFDSELLTEPVDNVFDVTYWQQQDLVIGSAQGRGTTWFVQLQKTAAALRHYRRGGLFGKIVKDNYLFSGWNNTRSIAEFNLLNKLINSGVNVPKPIAARAIKNNFTYTADLLSEKISHARDLVSILQEHELSTEQYKLIGQEIKKMHQQQVNHTDLNIHNILLDDAGKVWLIDFDKCDEQNGDDWKVKNISRLKRSFLKEKNKRNIYFNEQDFTKLLDAYEQY
ncbi:3-deoxy-D-manno-octulosonic acid kinase [Psychromonas sp.]|nr:3-deoxy-D-manno-octulosonic acid kinase [Psychromonas sp.]